MTKGGETDVATYRSIDGRVLAPEVEAPILSDVVGKGIFDRGVPHASDGVHSGSRLGCANHPDIMGEAEDLCTRES